MLTRRKWNWRVKTPSPSQKRGRQFHSENIVVTESLYHAQIITFTYTTAPSYRWKIIFRDTFFSCSCNGNHDNDNNDCSTPNSVNMLFINCWGTWRQLLEMQYNRECGFYHNASVDLVSFLLMELSFPWFLVLGLIICKCQVVFAVVWVQIFQW